MTLPYKTLSSFNFTSKRALVRVDLNVPIHNGVVSDYTRIERVIPTLQYLIQCGAKVIVLSHFDRPNGKIVPSMSLAPICKALEKALNYPVKFVETNWTDNFPETAVSNMQDGDIIVLENTRFIAAEEKNDTNLSKKMAMLGDVFVQDAFSCAHRKHCSTAGIADFLPSVAGLACEGELIALNAALFEPQRPVMAIVGGAKISTKIDLLSNLVHKVNKIVIAGGMANTFLAAQGINVGVSIHEHNLFNTARQIMKDAEAANCQLILPVDVVVATEFKAHATHYHCALEAIPSDMMILDIGPKTIAYLDHELATIHTVLWNGPFGAFELEPFNIGTNAIAQIVAKLTKLGTMQSIAGGGDTVSALNGAKVANDFTYISTAGGAFLEMLEGKILPGIEVLRG